MPAQAEPLAYIFATCTGRFSAELEHAWLMGNPETESIAHRRAQFEDLLYAVATDGEHRNLLNRRINAKQAHAQILQQAGISVLRQANTISPRIRRSTNPGGFVATVSISVSVGGA